jgi:hypothetical protein
MNVLLISGGRHPYHETTPVLRECLEKAGGHKVTLTDSADELSGGLDGFDAIVLNTRRDKEGGNDLPAAKRDGLRSFVQSGGGLVSLHIWPASCPDWPEMKKITGGGWVNGKSNHPPFGWFQVTVSKPSHAMAKGVPTEFWTFDECYCDLDIQPGIDVFMHGVVNGIERSLGWSHRYGRGKVANIALGHAGPSQQHPVFQRLALNAVEYVTAK